MQKNELIQKLESQIQSLQSKLTECETKIDILTAYQNDIETLIHLYQSHGDPSISHDTVIQESLKVLIESIGRAETATFYLWDGYKEKLSFIAQYPRNRYRKVIHQEFRKSHGVAGWVAELRDSYICNEPLHDKHLIGSEEQKRRLKALICCPAMAERKLIGVLCASKYSEYSKPFDHEFDRKIFQNLGSIIGRNINTCLKMKSTMVKANQDELTGLFRKETFNEIAQKEIIHAMIRGQNISFAMVDVDNFKKINTEKGHPEGDKLLRSLGAWILKFTNSIEGIPGRIGGEEFGVILEKYDKKHAYHIMERLRKIVETELNMTISIGVSSAL